MWLEYAKSYFIIQLCMWGGVKTLLHTLSKLLRVLLLPHGESRTRDRNQLGFKQVCDLLTIGLW
jgi:SUMO ligase MMS21 Smc5/6 complex component